MPNTAGSAASGAAPAGARRGSAAAAATTTARQAASAAARFHLKGRFFSGTGMGVTLRPFMALITSSAKPAGADSSGSEREMALNAS